MQKWTCINDSLKCHLIIISMACSRGAHVRIRMELSIIVRSKFCICVSITEYSMTMDPLTRNHWSSNSGLSVRKQTTWIKGTLQPSGHVLLAYSLKSCEASLFQYCYYCGDWQQTWLYYVLISEMPCGMINSLVLPCHLFAKLLSMLQ